MKVRTRFAVSPTGFMHVGGVRTALFSWALARKHSGQFVLRIEDTDKAREVAGSTDHIVESLKWLGLDWDEGPIVGGEFGPYTQSERLDMYREWAQKLIDLGHAYADPYTDTEVEAFRKSAQAEKRPFLFRDHRPRELDTPKDWYKKQTLRFKTPEIKRYEWHDVVRGPLSAGEEALDDFVLIKADGYPTYNFAHVIDDHLMEITHVIRGEEFIASVPKYLSLMDALQIERPTFVTVPPILNSNGGKKLSKRDGAKDALAYRDEGYLPQVVVNFLASMGWNDGTENEVFTPDEFVAAFSPERVQKGGAKFDETKLDWLNWQHIERLVAEGDYDTVLSLAMIEKEVAPEIIHLAMTKANSIDSLRAQIGIFIMPPSFSLTEAELKNVDKKLSVEMARHYVTAARDALKSIDFSMQDIEKVLRSTMEKLDAKPRHFLNLVRWVLSGQKVSPSLFETISLLGQDETVKRPERRPGLIQLHPLYCLA